MRAWQFTGTGEPLDLAEVPEPVAEPGEVVLEVKAAGLCHSDVGLLEDPGWLSLLAKRPITIGHEVAGVVSEVGAGVTGWQVGDRAAICPLTLTMPGYYRDGGFAAKATARHADLVRIPDGVSFAQAAVGTDAGMTSYRAVVTAGNITAGTRVGIIGLGGLGQIGARVAVLRGAEVFVAEVNPKLRALAEEIGAKRFVADVRDLADEKLDVIIDFAGFGTTTAAAVDIIHRDGTVVLVGMGRLEATIDTKSLITNQCRLVGSNGGDIADIESVYALIAQGGLDPIITAIEFDEIPDGLGRLHAGAVVGRLVAHIGTD
ncbi:zinc-binding dehydrogenase [Nocardia sp. CA2R105]|uniref:zinc-binding dehydrogenase n=1 Tax=Nocardia coffeae TaxID=2873381 RepID=UPI001CA79859|nr:zinc-binding dehydrogenase [Nocardia coffeae]MBY8857127.1 zinc-binding dehydrogenase [Nocardia coffeae]